MPCARALIRWSAQQLADASVVGVTTIRRAELTASETKLPGPVIRPSAAYSRPQASSSLMLMGAARE
jgi:hypothetical protein